MIARSLPIALIALAWCSPAGAGDAPERITLGPLAVDDSAAALDAVSRGLLESAAFKELGRATGACVIGPKELRAISDHPHTHTSICGTPLPRALETRWAVLPRVLAAKGLWTFWVRVVDTRGSLLIAKAKIEAASLSSLLTQFPALFEAVTDAALGYPRPGSRVLGVLAVD